MAPRRRDRRLRQQLRAPSRRPGGPTRPRSDLFWEEEGGRGRVRRDGRGAEVPAADGMGWNTGKNKQARTSRWIIQCFIRRDNQH